MILHLHFIYFFKELKNMGLLTEAEFTAAKAKLLDIPPSAAAAATATEEVQKQKSPGLPNNPSKPTNAPEDLLNEFPSFANKKSISPPNKDWRKAKDKLLLSSQANTIPDASSFGNVRSSYTSNNGQIKSWMANGDDGDSNDYSMDEENEFDYDDFESAV